MGAGAGACNVLGSPRRRAAACERRSRELEDAAFAERRKKRANPLGRRADGVDRLAQLSFRAPQRVTPVPHLVALGDLHGGDVMAGGRRVVAHVGHRSENPNCAPASRRERMRERLHGSLHPVALPNCVITRPTPETSATRVRPTQSGRVRLSATGRDHQFDLLRIAGIRCGHPGATPGLPGARNAIAQRNQAALLHGGLRPKSRNRVTPVNTAACRNDWCSRATARAEWIARPSAS